MARTVKHPQSGLFNPWRHPVEKWWKHLPGPPAWYRRLKNRKLRHAQEREIRTLEEIRTPSKRNVAWLWW